MTSPAEIRTVRPDDALARRVLREYTDEVASRWYGRPATTAEVDAALAEDPSDELAAPGGTFLVALDAAGEPIGCAGLELAPDGAAGVGEVKRVFVTPAARGTGLGGHLLDAVESFAAGRGVRRVQLDTRHDLVESHRLYEGRGYVRVPAFNGGPYSERWYAKELARTDA
ncbi:GNAT family N-acetyltransferase [Cellulomonas sp. PhB143]|uniref:GNAT family N-acetyltransferase n=1 Tax=Cellulomonas sp. PhB143 TaxID=2485186 RepID=UPI000FA3E4B3|nr:GNAT family N-acetyltransferase [Cellulomonas sp. PhB143]ROS77050.1 acetyltransferase (GNAT) family protein [Cellulomonas sp. PhB143]